MEAIHLFEPKIEQKLIEHIYNKNNDAITYLMSKQIMGLKKINVRLAILFRPIPAYILKCMKMKMADHMTSIRTLVDYDTKYFHGVQLIFNAAPIDDYEDMTVYDNHEVIANKFIYLYKKGRIQEIIKFSSSVFRLLNIPRIRELIADDLLFMMLLLNMRINYACDLLDTYETNELKIFNIKHVKCNIELIQHRYRNVFYLVNPLDYKLIYPKKKLKAEILINSPYVFKPLTQNEMILMDKIKSILLDSSLHAESVILNDKEYISYVNIFRGVNSDKNPDIIDKEYRYEHRMFHEGSSKSLQFLIIINFVYRFIIGCKFTRDRDLIVLNEKVYMFNDKIELTDNTTILYPNISINSEDIKHYEIFVSKNFPKLESLMIMWVDIISNTNCIESSRKIYMLQRLSLLKSSNKWSWR